MMPRKRSSAALKPPLTRGQVGQLLGLSSWETEAFLKGRHAHLPYTEEDLEKDRKDIERIVPQ
jgi:hypothetical protein